MLVLIAVCAAGMVTNTVLDQVERQAVPTYGSRVQVTGGAVNVYRHGDQGPTIVMLSGYDTPAPALDFAPLIRQLGNVQVVVVEGLGYGYSDTTGSPRTIENITGDLHEALTAARISKPYILLGHSIAGIYDLYYANRYRTEISAVIGIDASVPGQINGLAAQANPWNRLIATTGVLRIATAISPPLIEPDGTAYTSGELQQIRLMTNWNWANPALLDEANKSDHNFAAVQNLTYPRELPVLSFIKTDDNPPNWRQLHLAQLREVDRGQLVELDGGHYLHWTHAATIAQQIHQFLQTANVTQ